MSSWIIYRKIKKLANSSLIEDKALAAQLLLTNCEKLTTGQFYYLNFRQGVYKLIDECDLQEYHHDKWKKEKRKLPKGKKTTGGE